MVVRDKQAVTERQSKTEPVACRNSFRVLEVEGGEGKSGTDEMTVVSEHGPMILSE